MTADALVARDEIYELINNAIVASLPGVIVHWEGVEGVIPQNSKWLRVSLRHVTGRQASLAGENGVRRWNRTGFVSVQCFAPLASGGVKAATEMACVVRDALQGKATESCVWFRNPRINEVGVDGDWFNVNATIDFDYDELR